MNELYVARCRTCGSVAAAAVCQSIEPVEVMRWIDRGNIVSLESGPVQLGGGCKCERAK